MRHDEIARRFNAALARSCRTVIIGGASEPLYRPPTGNRPAIIRYTRDYAQSALHEIAHWCVAGPGRRSRVDYGYWYQPPPRSAAAQARFEAAEVPIQGLELLLALVSGVRFHVSADNPGAAEEDLPGLEGRIVASARRRLGRPFGTRTAAVLGALNPGWRNVLEVFRRVPPAAEEAAECQMGALSADPGRSAHARA